MTPNAAAPTRLPLVRGPLDRPVARSVRGRRLDVAGLLGAAQAVAARLPAGATPVNLCRDRLAFAVALLAGAVRGRTAWMPANARADTLARLQRLARAEQGEHARLVALVDDADPALRATLAAAGLAVLDVDADGDASGASAATALAHADADLELVRLFTSGSTGEPQPHGKTLAALHANLDAEAQRLAQWLGRADLTGVALLATVPPQHSYGFESAVMLALLGGALLDAANAFYPADIVAAIERAGAQAAGAPRVLVTTPFHLKTLLGAGLALPPVELVLSATAPLAPQLAAQAERALGAFVGEIYGCTEAGQVASRRTVDGPAWTTLGALTLQQRPPRGDEAAPVSIVEGGHVLAPTELADVLELVDADASGRARRFTLLGRANDILHVAGKRTSLARLNFELNRVEGVDDGAFFMPDDEGGSRAVRPVAFVVAPTLDAAQVIAALRGVLEPAFVPRHVVHVDALPREGTGKLTVAALADFAARLAAERRAAGARAPW